MLHDRLVVRETAHVVPDVDEDLQQPRREHHLEQPPVLLDREDEPQHLEAVDFYAYKPLSLHT